MAVRPHGQPADPGGSANQTSIPAKITQPEAAARKPKKSVEDEIRDLCARHGMTESELNQRFGTQAIGDGAFLKKLFAFLAELLPIILPIIGGGAKTQVEPQSTAELASEPTS